MKNISREQIRQICKGEHEDFLNSPDKFEIVSIIITVGVEILLANKLLDQKDLDEACDLARNELVKYGEEIKERKTNAYS